MTLPSNIPTLADALSAYFLSRRGTNTMRGNVVPDTASLYDIGSSANPLRAIYVQNLISVTSISTHTHATDGQGGQLDWDNIWSDATHDHSSNAEGGTSLSGVSITSGTITGITDLVVADGGTGVSTFTDGGLLVGAGVGAIEALAVGLTTQILVGGGAATNPAWGTDIPTAVTIGTAYIYRVSGTDVAVADGGTGQSTAGAGFNALSPMTTLGDTIYGAASGAGTRLAGNTTTTKKYLSQIGDGANSAAPAWAQVAVGDISGGAALTKTDDTNVTLSLGGAHATALLAATSLTLGWTGTLAAARLNANVVQGITNDTNVTGSIATQTLTLGWTGTLAAARLNANVVQAITNDTNVTGSIATQTLTLGWTGQLSLARGGTNANLTASHGAVVYSTASALALSGVGTAGQLLQSAAAASPAWTSDILTTTTIGTKYIYRAEGTNVAVADGGTNLDAGTSGGILGYTATGVLASSVLLTASALVLGGGADATPTPLGSLGTTTTLLHGNAAGVPSWAAVGYADIAAMTSAQLAGIISDETGSGALMFATSPTITTSLIMADGATIGQAAGPLITFNDTGNILAIMGCSVSIGGTSPITKLDVTGELNLGSGSYSNPASGTALDLRYSSALAAGNIRSRNWDTSTWMPLYLEASVYYLTEGNVGIHTLTPRKLADFLSTSQAQLRLTYTDNSVYTDFQVDASGNLTITPTGAGIIIPDGKTIGLGAGKGLIQFDDEATDFVSIMNANLGVGIAVPLNLLHVKGTGGAAIDIDTGTDGYNAGLNFRHNGALKNQINSAATTFNLDFWVNGANTIAMTILQPTGLVGIATTVPDKALEVNSATGACLRLTYNDANGSATYYTDFAVSSAGNLTVTPSGTLVNFPSTASLRQTSYASQTTGWQVGGTGSADFRYLYTDELHARAFIADMEQALAGGQIICKSVTKVASDFTLPAAGASGSLVVEELAGFTGHVFVDADLIRLRQTTRAADTSLTIADGWGTVVYASRDGTANPPTQTYTFTRSAAPNAGTGSGTVLANTLALDYGTAANSYGYHEISAVDGAYGVNAPYAQTVTWATHPAVQANRTVRTRIGNLKGITNALEYGLYAGNVLDGGTLATTNRYIRLSDTTFSLNNLDLSIYNGGAKVIAMDYATPYFSIGNPAPTSYLGATGYWTGNSSGTYKSHLGTVSGGVLTKGYSWDGTNFSIIGNLTIAPSGANLNYGVNVGEALLLAHYDGPRPYETDYSGNANGHRGQVATKSGGVVFRPGKFSKAVQIAEATTNYVLNPSAEANLDYWSVWYGDGTAVITRDADNALYGSYGVKSVVSTGYVRQFIAHSWNTIGASDGQTWTGSVWYKTTVANQRGEFCAFNAGSDIQQTAYTDYWTADGAWHRASVTMVLSGATIASICLLAYLLPGTTYFDGVQLEQKAYATPFCSGDLSGSGATAINGNAINGHCWTGARNASTSSRVVTNLNYPGIGNISTRKGTYAFWWSTPAGANGVWHELIRYGSHYNAGNIEIFKYVDESLFAEYFCLGDASPQALASGALAWTANTWYHIVLTWDLDANLFVIYRNGAVVASSTPFSGKTDATPGDNTIHVGAAGGGTSGLGLIDDLCILPVALSAAEVKAIYDSNAPIQAETNTGELRLMSATANGGYVFGNSNGLYGVDATGTSRFSILTDGSGTLGTNGIAWTTAGVVTVAGWTLTATSLADAAVNPKTQLISTEGILLSSGTWGTDTTVFAAVFADDGTVASLDAGDVIIGRPFHATDTSQRGLHWDNSAAALYLKSTATEYIKCAGTAIEFYAGAALAKVMDITSTPTITIGAASLLNVYITTTGVQIRDADNVYASLFTEVLTLGLVAGGEYATIDGTNGIKLYGAGALTVQIENTGDATFGVVAASKFNLFWDASEGDLSLRRNTTPYFAVDGSAGLLQFGANTTDVTQTAITVLGAAQYYNGENLGSGDMVLGNNAKEAFSVTITGVFTMGESFRDNIDGECYLANGNAVPAVGIYFKVNGTTDTHDNALAAAKGSAPAVNDFFRVTDNTEATGAVTYAGNAIGDQANVLWDKSAGKLNFRGGVTTQAYVDTTGAITAGAGAVTLNSTGISITGGKITLIREEAAAIVMGLYGNNTAGGCWIKTYGSQGTNASPTSSTANDYLFSLDSYGYYTGGYKWRAQWSIIASENWTNTAQGTKQVFYTTNTGTTTIREHLLLDGDGKSVFAGSITSNGGLQTFGANDSGGAGYRLVRVPNV